MASVLLKFKEILGLSDDDDCEVDVQVAFKDFREDDDAFIAAINFVVITKQ